MSACEKCGVDPDHPAEVDAYCLIVDGEARAKTQIKVPGGFWNLMGMDREPAGFLGARYKPRYQFLAWDHQRSVGSKCQACDGTGEIFCKDRAAGFRYCPDCLGAGVIPQPQQPLR
jgi:hypothetical protein